MLVLYVAQTILPLALIAWLAIAPPRSIIAFSIQSIAIGVALVAIGFVGIWTFPPWWAPFAFGALLVAVVMGRLARRCDARLWPQGIMGWIVLVLFAALAFYGACQIPLAVAASRLPEGRLVDLASPLGSGTYLVANGGASLSVNAHAELLDQSVARHRPYWGTAHGVDLVAIDRWGLRADGIMPTAPAAYRIFGRSVIAPCGGKVIVAVDGLPDMKVPQVDSDHLAGNYVILRCAGADILLGHFRQGSLLVRVGQNLGVGEAIAQVGNSGNTSEPHLHINAQAPGTAARPFSGAPVPIRINGRYLARNDRLVVRTKAERP